jgi:predicted ABC-type transport system involved in lysophospholipase L1 biosynthesis ATPase subunit
MMRSTALTTQTATAATDAREPLVSVVIIFFNAERFLGEAVESVLAQTYRHWELLLADEPTGNLDHRTGEIIFQMIQELHSERDLTSVIVTHNERIAVQCDEVWELDAGVFRHIQK